MGGAELALLDLVASIRAAEPDWSLHLIAGADGPLASRAEAIGVQTTILPFPPALARLGDSRIGGSNANRTMLMMKLFGAAPSIVRYVGKLKRELRRLKPDLLHTNGFKMHLLGARALPAKSVPVIWHVRDYLSCRPMMARLMKRYVSRCSAIVTNSRSVADDVRAVCGDRLKIYPVLDAIDLERFSPTGNKLDLDALSGLPESHAGTIKVGLLATMAYWKGHDTFLDAISRLPTDLNLRGYVIGGALYQTDGSQHSLDELRNEAVRLGLGDRVGFTGFVEDAASAMRALDIVVHASTRPEPFGLVIAEAMACSRALVASEAGGAAEIITKEVNALGHNPGDAAGLAECIKRLAMDADLRKRLGEAGRATAERDFDRARLATELIPIYEEAIAMRL